MFFIKIAGKLTYLFGGGDGIREEPCRCRAVGAEVLQTFVLL